MKLIVRSIGILLFVFCLFSQDLFAADLRTKYFDVKVDSSVDLYQLVRKLAIFDTVSIDSSTSAESSVLLRTLSRELDKMYAEVSDILDIHMYKNTINLRIFPDRGPISKILAKNYSGNTSMPSFYDAQSKTIYISFSDLTVNMLGHEVAHAIISRYFVVPPSTKVQEILAGYVDFKIQKKR